MISVSGHGSSHLAPRCMLSPRRSRQRVLQASQGTTPRFDSSLDQPHLLLTDCEASRQQSVVHLHGDQGDEKGGRLGGDGQETAVVRAASPVLASTRHTPIARSAEEKSTLRLYAVSVLSVSIDNSQSLPVGKTRRAGGRKHSFWLFFNLWTQDTVRNTHSPVWSVT